MIKRKKNEKNEKEKEKETGKKKKKLIEIIIVLVLLFLLFLTIHLLREYVVESALEPSQFARVLKIVIFAVINVCSFLQRQSRSSALHLQRVCLVKLDALSNCVEDVAEITLFNKHKKI